jgi:hypothetical protein
VNPENEARLKKVLAAKAAKEAADAADRDAAAHAGAEKDRQKADAAKAWGLSAVRLQTAVSRLNDTLASEGLQLKCTFDENNVKPALARGFITVTLGQATPKDASMRFSVNALGKGQASISGKQGVEFEIKSADEEFYTGLALSLLEHFYASK